jgi:hypothetical protein
MTRLSSTDHAAMAMALSDFTFGEQLFLWGIRMWVRSYNEGTNIHNILHNGFKLAGVPTALGALDAMMGIFTTSGQGIIDIRCPKCTEVSLDEHRIMGAIAVLQHTDQPSDGKAYLSWWLPSAALRIVRGPSSQLADIMKQGGLMIRARPWARNLRNDHEMVISESSENHILH